ncbi:phage tail tip lysozyme [Erysipelotrichaceae bacterium 66-17]
MDKRLHFALMGGIGFGFLLTGQAVFAEELPEDAVDDSMMENYTSDETLVNEVSSDVYIDENQNSENKLEKTNFEMQTNERTVNSQVSISSGVYTISSAVNSGQVVDVSNGSTDNGANIQIYENNDSGAQIWKIEYGTDGLYTFTNIQSNKVLDVNGGYIYSGNNVQQYQSNGTLAQKWQIDSMNGTYKISSALNKNYVLDLNNADSKNGSNIQIYQSNNTKAQRWIFTPYKFKSDYLLPTGVYTISSAVNTGQVVDVNNGSKDDGANIQIYQNNDTGAQIWKVDYGTDGLYTFTNVQSNKSLDVNGGYIYSGNNVQQYQSNGTLAQKWRLESINGAYKISSALNKNYVLDLSNADSKNGSNIQIYQSNNTKAQRWFFNKYITKEQEMDSMAAMNKNLVANGQYYIVNSQTGQVLSVYGQSTGNQANVDLEKNYQASSQVWEISHDLKGYITFKNIGSGKVLDVAGANTASGTNLQIYESNGTRAQKWVVRRDGSNFEIISALDPDRAIAQSGSNAQISVQNSSLAAEKWILKKAEDLRTRLDQIAKNNLNVVADGAYVIRSALNDKMVLDVNAGSTANGANIQVYEYNGSNAQKFLITNDAKGYVTIKNIGSGKFVSVDGKGWNGNNVMQSAQSNGWNQKWIIVKTNNTYQIVSALNDSFVLDVTAALAMNGTNIQIYESNGTKAQQFLFGSLNKDDSLWISSNNYLTVSQMENNAQLVWNFFKGYGWTKNAVAALLGNMQGESNINPGLWESRDEGNMNCGYGLVQWTPANKVIDWLEGNGYAINSGFGQCARIIYELENHIQYYATNAFNFSFYDFAHSTQTPEYLAKAFIYNYERPYNYNQPQRETYARNWYNYISKL